VLERLRALPRALLDDAIALLLPPICPRCRRGMSAPGLCAPCRALFARPPADPRAASQAGVDVLYAATSFADELADWMHRFKYPERGWRGLDPAPGALVEALLREEAATLACDGARFDAVVPVPLHPRRVRERAFDPVYALARVAARALGAPLAASTLVRTRPTTSQTGLDRAGRRRNVAGAFAAPARERARLHGTTLLLVDDVVTTGATLHEAAGALRAAGAARIVGLCVARTPLGR
jgi:ComF family protein